MQDNNKRGETWVDLVKHLFPDATMSEAENLLWECTAFPFASSEHVEEQLRCLRHKANSPSDAMALSASEADLDRMEWDDDEEGA